MMIANPATNAVMVRARRAAAWLFFAACLVYGVWAITNYWYLPILDAHGFRQTQTAITTYYMVGQWPKLAYDTPIVGAPWSIPHEFPIYQWMVAAIVTVLGTPLDQTGRFVSVSMLYLTLIPLAAILRQLKVSWDNIPYVWGLFVINPFYIYWGRAFLIETTAMFFGVAFVAASMSFFRERRWGCFVSAAVMGGLCGLTKVTTAPPYLGLMVIDACVLALARLYRPQWLSNLLIDAPSGSSSQPSDGPALPPSHRTPFVGRSRVEKSGLLPLVALLLIIIGTTAAWTRFADAVKEQNLAGRTMTSRGEALWVWGTWDMRFDAKHWQTIWRHAVSFSFQSWFLVAAIAGFLITRKRWLVVLACLAMWGGTSATFINLYWRHGYYSSAVEVLWVVAIGCAIVGLLEQPGWRMYVGYALAALSFVQTCIVREELQLAMYPRGRHIDFKAALGDRIRGVTDPNDVIIVFGDDWSSEIPYYARRRAIMVTWKIGSASELEETVRRTQAAGHRIGAVVVVPFRQNGPEWVWDEKWSPDPWATDEASRRLTDWGISRTPSYLNPNATIYPKAEEAEFYRPYVQAVELARGTKYDEALKVLEPLPEQRPANPELWALRSMLRLQSGDFRGAIADSKKCLELSPLNLDAIQAQAVAMMFLFRKEGAAALPEDWAVQVDRLLDQALVFVPGNVELLTRKMEMRNVRR